MRSWVRARRRVAGPVALVAVMVAVVACETLDDPGGLGQTSGPTGTPDAGVAVVDVCALVDPTILDRDGIAVETSYQATDGGVLPSDSCPLFPADEEGTRGSLGDLRVAMTPVTPEEFGQARDVLGGEPVSGVGDQAFTASMIQSGLPGRLSRRSGSELYILRDELVMSFVRPAEQITEQHQLALVEEALRRLPAPFAFTPQAWPAECDRLDRGAAEALLGGPVRATRGRVDDRNRSCEMFTAPGWVAIYYRQEPSTLETSGLDRVPGIGAEAYVDPGGQNGYVLAGGREAFLDIWLPDVDLAGVKTGPFDEITPELGALFQDVADAMAG